MKWRNVSTCILATECPIDAIEPSLCAVKSGESADTNNSIPQKNCETDGFPRQGGHIHVYIRHLNPQHLLLFSYFFFHLSLRRFSSILTYVPPSLPPSLLPSSLWFSCLLSLLLSFSLSSSLCSIQQRRLVISPVAVSLPPISQLFFSRYIHVLITIYMYL